MPRGSLGIGLGGGEKLHQFGRIGGVFPILILRIALDVFTSPTRDDDDEFWGPFFDGVG